MNAFLLCCRCSLSHLRLIALMAGYAVSNADAVVFSTGFDDYTGPGIAGANGWTINDDSPGLSNLEEIVLPNLQSTLAATLGGFYSEPSADSVFLSRNYDGVLSQTTISFTLGIFDSRNANPARDLFGFSFAFGDEILFSLIASPGSQSSTPESGQAASWSLLVSNGTQPATPLGLSMEEGLLYGISIAFSPSASKTAYLLELETESGLSAARSGTLPWGQDKEISELGFLWTPLSGPEAAGSNYLLVDNVAVIPEPSTSMLWILPVGALLCRRRR